MMAWSFFSASSEVSSGPNGAHESAASAESDDTSKRTVAKSLELKEHLLTGSPEHERCHP
jgi:hypothetical protein